MQTQIKPQETWIKVLSKGTIAIPKVFREQLGLEEGDIAKAKVEGNKLIIRSKKSGRYKDYRVYTKEQIDQWVREDQLPEPLATQTKNYWSKIK